jgi:hypothetical protein
MSWGNALGTTTAFSEVAGRSHARGGLWGASSLKPLFLEVGAEQREAMRSERGNELTLWELLRSARLFASASPIPFPLGFRGRIYNASSVFYLTSIPVKMIP